MGSKVTFDYSKADAFISAHEMESMKKITEAAKAELLGREGAGNDFLGWIDLPVDYDKEEFERIKKAAAKIQSGGFRQVRHHPQSEGHPARRGRHLDSFRLCA